MYLISYFIIVQACSWLLVESRSFPITITNVRYLPDCKTTCKMGADVSQSTQQRQQKTGYNPCPYDTKLYESPEQCQTHKDTVNPAVTIRILRDCKTTCNVGAEISQSTQHRQQRTPVNPCPQNEKLYNTVQECQAAAKPPVDPTQYVWYLPDCRTTCDMLVRMSQPTQENESIRCPAGTKLYKTIEQCEAGKFKDPTVTIRILRDCKTTCNVGADISQSTQQRTSVNLCPQNEKLYNTVQECQADKPPVDPTVTKRILRDCKTTCNLGADISQSTQRRQQRTANNPCPKHEKVYNTVQECQTAKQPVDPIVETRICPDCKTVCSLVTGLSQSTQQRKLKYPPCEEGELLYRTVQECKKDRVHPPAGKVMYRIDCERRCVVPQDLDRSTQDRSPKNGIEICRQGSTLFETLEDCEEGGERYLKDCKTDCYLGIVLGISKTLADKQCPKDETVFKTKAECEGTVKPPSPGVKSFQ